MSRTIKLEDSVYNTLTGLMGPKETYSQVVERILTLFDKMGELRNVLEGAARYRQEQKEILVRHGVQNSDAIGTDLSGKRLIEHPPS